MLSFSFYTCLVLFIIVCLFLILLILIQKGRGGGLASAFGGAGGNTAFGSKTGDVLTWATSIVFGVFIVLAVVLNLISNKMDEKYRAELAAQNTIVLPPPPGLPQGLEGLLNRDPAALPPVEEPAAPAAVPTTLPAGQ